MAVPAVAAAVAVAAHSPPTPHLDYAAPPPQLRPLVLLVLPIFLNVFTVFLFVGRRRRLVLFHFLPLLLLLALFLQLLD